MKKWEYSIDHWYRYPMSENNLNEMGQEGWELCNIEKRENSEVYWEYTFKRELTDKEDKS